MINVQLYHQSKHLIPFLGQYFAGSEKILIITPNPILADIARNKFGQTHQNVETITISKFLKDELNILFPPDQLTNFYGKSDLNLLLGTLWKINFPKLSYEKFKRSFQILTDFRSFTLNTEVLSEVLENYDQEIAEGTITFQRILETMNVIDEHRSYFELANRLREGDLPVLYPLNRTIMFWGFDFLTGSQLDLLNALSIRDEVVITFPEEAYVKSKDFDWIKWLTKSEAKITTIDSKILDKPKLDILEFPKKYLAKTLKSLKKIHTEKLEYIIGTKNLTQDYVTEIPFGDISYKVPVDLFEAPFKLFFNQLESYTLSKKLTLTQVNEFCHGYVENLKKQHDYKSLKVVSVFLDVFNRWSEISDKNNQFSIFDLKIVKDSVHLDLPRNSLFKGAKDFNNSLKSLKTIEQANSDSLKILCVTSDYEPLKGSVIQYEENVEKYLAAIGPIRRNELEFLMLKAKIKDHFLEGRNLLVIEQGMLKQDPGWNFISTEFDLKRIDTLPLPVEEKRYIFDFTNQKYDLHSISASKMQMYLDCPRKFHLNYVLKQKPRVELSNQLNYLQLGLIEHLVIEKYLKQYSEFDNNYFNKMVNEVLDQFEKEGNLPLEKKEEYALEVRSLCAVVIDELLQFNKTFGFNLEFEKELPNNENITIQGSIDCFGYNKDSLMVLDFKRGSSSIPSLVGFKDFQKIQLWFYLNRLKKNQIYLSEKNLIIGYLNLSNLEDSLIYCSNESDILKIKSLNLKLSEKVYHFDMAMEDAFTKYIEYETNIWEKINLDHQFVPNPSSPQICNYCELANICPKQLEVSNGQS